MYEVNSLGIFVGTGDCNGNCKHCAGKLHRKYAPKEDGIIDKDLITKTLKDCYRLGARYLTISSSGEPTLSPLAVTRTLRLVDSLKKERITYNPINLYSNGIRIGQDLDFCNQYLPKWQKLGLRKIYLTVHNSNEKENAKVYGVKNYPSLEKIVERVHQANINVRANLVLAKNIIGTFENFYQTVNSLRKIGVDEISAWPIRNKEDKPDKDSSPIKEELDQIVRWSKQNNVRVLTEQNHEVYKNKQKLTLFPDGVLSNTWCN